MHAKAGVINIIGHPHNSLLQGDSCMPAPAVSVVQCYNNKLPQLAIIKICDRICKKGSYTRTTSTHRFHHHSIDTLSDNPWVHVLWPTVHQSAFPEVVSGARQTSMNARFVFSCLCWLLNKGHRAVRSHTTL